MPQILTLIAFGALLAMSYAHGRLRTAYREQARSMAVLQRMADERLTRIAELSNQSELQIGEAKALKGVLEQRQATLAARDAELERTEAKLKTLEEALKTKTEEQTYKIALALTLSNAAYDALLVIDENCHVIASNMSAEVLFDDPRPIGKKLTDITKTPALESMVESVLANEEEVYEEQLTIHERFYRVRAQVIRRDSNLFIGLALQDVTELVRLNRARRDMVANISHELRTPIANIRLIIDGLFHDQDKPKRKESISSLRAVARETDNLLWLVQEMADLSMIESGQAIVRMVDVLLPEIVTEAVERLSDQIDAKKIAVVQNVPKNMRVLCDRDLTQRVLVNLIHNAMKWSPEGGKITISASEAPNSDEVTVRVTDTGPGVPDDQVERIFERFYQVDASRSGNDGTGLGLAICRHIVGAHGGNIWAEGNHGGQRPGGQFLFTLLKGEIEENSSGISQNTVNMP